ncbi:MAG: response regulator, partial [Pseudomonadota bacterium]
MSNSKRILIVDDNAVIRRILREELGVADFIIDEADSGEKALEMIASRTIPDLITIDVEMPGLSGFELFETLLSEPFTQYFSHLPDQQPPVVFISSHDTVEDRKKGFELGATDFITKPFNRGQVLSVVNKILHPEKILGDLLALVVDDSRMAREIVAKILRQEGINVLEAQNGIQAYEIICNHMSGIDIVITDLNMPKMNGDKLVGKIRKELDLKDLPIIFLTGETDNTRLLDLFECGGSDYLIKPFVKEELMARIMVHLERRELTRRLRESVKELSNLSKMKDDLIAVCSHDLRSPLHGILGYIDMLIEKKYIKKEDREGLKDIKDSGAYLLELINDILDLSRIQSNAEDISMQPLNASHLAEACYKAMKNMADSKQVEFFMEDQCKNAIVSGNRSSLMRAINNLLSNAIKFTPSGNTVTLKIELTTEKDKDKRLSIKVIDTGIGIEQSMIPALFDKYSRSSRKGTKGEKGTGLGMSIVREIVKLHNGEVKVDS